MRPPEWLAGVTTEAPVEVHRHLLEVEEAYHHHHRQVEVEEEEAVMDPWLCQHPNVVPVNKDQLDLLDHLETKALEEKMAVMVKMEAMAKTVLLAKLLVAVTDTEANPLRPVKFVHLVHLDQPVPQVRKDPQDQKEHPVVQRPMANVANAVKSAPKVHPVVQAIPDQKDRMASQERLIKSKDHPDQPDHQAKKDQRDLTDRLVKMVSPATLAVEAERAKMAMLDLPASPVPQVDLVEKAPRVQLAVAITAQRLVRLLDIKIDVLWRLQIKHMTEWVPLFLFMVMENFHQ